MATYRVNSMTSFGRAQGDTPRGQFVVEVRTVNNRFLDLSVALPRELNVLETALRGMVRQQISRGKVEMRVRYTPNEEQQPHVELNRAMASQYIEQLRRLQELGCEGDVSLGLLAGLPGVLESAPPEVDEQEMWRCLQPVAEQAMEAMQRERSREGLAIGEQLHGLAAALRARIAELDDTRGPVVEKFRDKLLQRIGELMAGAKDQLDPGRIEQEAALLADKADISEEIVRLRAHLDRFGELMSASADEPVGKNVDFLVQEFNREVNTICSKTRDTELTSLGLEMKSLVEKIREQIQNVE
jgi:uncharacterized protein (TIGR00255 family)